MPLLNVIIDLYWEDTVDPENGFHDMKAAGVLGIIHKASQGTDVADPSYADRRERALSLGLLWGSYHFGIAGDPVGQANYYLSRINQTPSEIMVLDFEQYPTPPTDRPDETMSFAEAEQFVQEIYKQTGRYPALYSSSDFLVQHFGTISKSDTILANCPLWVARYDSEPPAIPPAFDNYIMWQYTDGTYGPEPHTVSGIDGDNGCDRSYFNGTAAELNSFWGVPNLGTFTA